jgi:hypothetical protein
MRGYWIQLFANKPRKTFLRTNVKQYVRERSGKQCEAYLPQMKTRCGREGIHIHHMLTRAHGGKILDEAEETYHLALLCAQCHTEAHRGSNHVTRVGGGSLLIEGYVHTENGRPIYIGPDRYLATTYARQSQGEDQHTT